MKTTCHRSPVEAGRVVDRIGTIVLWTSILGSPIPAWAAADAIEPLSPQARTPATTGDHWRIIGTKPGNGEMCLVCDKPILNTNAWIIRYRGRTVYINQNMWSEWERDADRYFRKVQARAALFDEQSLGPRALHGAWLGVGVYVLIGLVLGGQCAYTALAGGRSAIGWFFAGFVGNVVALAILMTRPPMDTSALPQGVPPGLVKVPVTHAPRRCGACGQSNHPAAVTCSVCGNHLNPVVEAETMRL